MSSPPFMELVALPSPEGWAGDLTDGIAEALARGLTAWVLDSVVWVVSAVFQFFLDATSPNVQADWFVRRDGPYGTTAAIGATLLVGFLLAGICQGALAGDLGGMIRQVALHLPMSVLGIVGLVSVTQALIALTDALSRAVLGRFDEDVDGFTKAVGSISTLAGGTSPWFVVFLVALVAVIAGVILVAELVIRSALIYIVVALAPLVFAAIAWPAVRGACRKLLELLFALILSKLVIAIALAVAAAAVVGVGSGGEVTAVPAPEVVPQNAGGSVTQAVGILIAAAAAFGVAAFSPLLVARLMPVTEAALVAQGVRGGPVRASQSAMAMSSQARAASGHRLNRMAAGPVGPGLSAGSPGAGAVAGGSAGAAIAGGMAAAGAATRAVGSGVRVMKRAASDAPSHAWSPSPPGRRGSARSGRASDDER